jgi:tetratricopeptide (TPR) repeat protein
MMKETRLKYIFLASSAFLLIVMLLMSRNAGISCDDVLHYHQSEAVYNYFATHGADQAALQTPVNHLKYYGQSFDNFVTVLIRWLRIDDVFGFRHLMSSLAGWLTIFITALLAIWLSGYRTGILVILLFAVSPTFLGHTQNNLKDIPFALGYILSVYFTLKILLPEKRVRFYEILLLILSISFTLSIRAGGLLMICYLFLFFFICLVYRYFINGRIDWSDILKKLMILILVAGASFFLSILLWPFGLQAPVKNVFASLNFMSHFPGTFREIFEGRTEWTDYMPWYYLLKYMAITIPVIVLAGTLVFIPFIKRIVSDGKTLSWLFLLFTILFPILFVIIERPNIYSGWRQFLFVYPPMIVVSAAGFNYLFDFLKNRYAKWILFAVLLVLAIHPVRYMVNNKAYFYLYYNQFTGGLKGAYGNYETDYYYTGQTEASGWLINYLKTNNIDSSRVIATFPVDWQFRNTPSVKTSCCRYEERSESDWDYAIITNRYIPPFMLKAGSWPPSNVIHVVYADRIPVCVVLKRKSKEDFLGYNSLEEHRSSDAVKHFTKALKIDNSDEMIFYNFARALYNEGEFLKADSALKKGLEINPVSEPILMYLGNISATGKDTVSAEKYYKELINVNRKYFDAYIELAKLTEGNDVQKTRKLLRSCLYIKPDFKPAIKALADTYRKSDPGIAEKYDKLLNSIN